MNALTVAKQMNEIDFTAEFTLVAMAANNILAHLKSTVEPRIFAWDTYHRLFL
jgi:hypothetical protein